MPATSRQGESGRTRSASGLAGSPSKSTSFQPTLVRRVWPRWRSPCTRWTASVPSPSSRSKVAFTIAACDSRAGTCTRQPSNRSRIRDGHRGGVDRARREVLAQDGVHVGHGAAEALRLAGEVAAHLVGVQVGLGEQVAHAGQGEVPAVGGRAQELLDHPEVVLAGLDPAVEGRDVVVLGLGEHLVDLDVGVAARSHLAEDLEQAVLAERDRGVALLAAEERRVRLRCRGRGRRPGGTSVRRTRGSSRPGSPRRRRGRQPSPPGRARRRRRA